MFSKKFYFFLKCLELSIKMKGKIQIVISEYQNFKLILQKESQHLNFTF